MSLSRKPTRVSAVVSRMRGASASAVVEGDEWALAAMHEEDEAWAEDAAAAQEAEMWMDESIDALEDSWERERREEYSDPPYLDPRVNFGYASIENFALDYYLVEAP